MSQSFSVYVAQGEVAFSDGALFADASRYLTYADKTDTFADACRLTEVTLHDDPKRNGQLVELQFIAELTDNGLKRFMDEMATLSRVRSVERVTEPNL